MTRFIFASVIVGLLFAIGFVTGSSHAKMEYMKQINEWQVQVEQAKALQQIISHDTVIEYRDRIKTVTEYKTQLIETVGSELHEENAQCHIGDNFIRLHNLSASDQSISSTTIGIDDETKVTGDDK